MQCSRWAQVKSNWGFEAVVCRNQSGEIIGSISVLIQRIPLIGTSFLYAPRGPVCDPFDLDTIKALISGVDSIAKKYKAHSFKMDPDIFISNKEFCDAVKGLGFTQICGNLGFETIQPRFNYRVYLNGKNEEQMLANLTQQTRRNVRIAQRNGVEVKICEKDYLGEFFRLMKTTGERDGFSVRPEGYFRQFLDSMGEHARLYLAFYNGRAIAGAIATNFAGKTSYVYGASDNEFRNVMPNYLVQWEMIRWAIQTNSTVYDLQGISGDLEDETNHLYGLYRFKRGFNGQVDELVGEFDRIYMPVREKLVNAAINANDVMRKIKKRLKGGS